MERDTGELFQRGEDQRDITAKGNVRNLTGPLDPNQGQMGKNLGVEFMLDGELEPGVLRMWL